jgi:hypothetical protein
MEELIWGTELNQKKKNKEKLFAVILYEWGFSPPRTWCSTGRCLVSCPSAADAAVPPAILNKILITRDAFRFLDRCWRISWFPWSLLIGDESNSGRGRVLISSVALLLADSTKVYLFLQMISNVAMKLLPQSSRYSTSHQIPPLKLFSRKNILVLHQPQSFETNKAASHSC